MSTASDPNRTTHSPGPWRLLLDSDGYPSSIECDNPVECACAYCQDGSGARQYDVIVQTDSHVYGPSLQDAYLITAAPELFAACKGALDWFEGMGYTGEDVDALKSALAKAEGK